ncbi:DUF748 domain-containing protein [Larkinella humicola]|uniref:DUF748 domain-containing protein n=1 Tax=Larkinella humicola TaxID=2607654 RepID=A0A5N1JEP4_9BACT|nr:DUF748 domain-containing protein [Larkinella humicola]KAA9353512.1 DUF748 domain-containing protein [Larkinella humicola]
MKRSTKIILAVVVVLIVARLLLPYFVLRYLNKLMADMGSYTGHVEDVDIALVTGSYQIKDLRIRKINGKIKEPFLYVPKIDLSVEWPSLFKGALVGEVECYRPELNFAFSNNEQASQTGRELDWTKLVKDILPIQINRFAAYDGKIDLVNLFEATKTDLSLEKVALDIRNIRNVEDKETRLPSPVTATGDVPGWGGTMKFGAGMYLLKPIPDFNYNLSFDNLQLVKLNDLARKYGNVDFESGTISVVSEMAMYDGRLVGYFKPLTKEMKIFKLKEPGEDRKIGRFFTELLAEGGTAILKNQKRDQVATRIPLRGTVEKTQTEVWPIIIGVLRNAYVEAFTTEFDNTVTFKDAVENLKEDYKEKRREKKAERKEARQERKEERKQKREERKEARKKEKDG